MQEKIDKSIGLLRRAEPMALDMSDKGFYLAFSGGKDSQTLYHIAKMAGVKFEPHYAVTTIDPPELVHFIRRQYPDVIFDRPKMNFFQLCVKKRMLPTITARFCCAVLKETNGAGTVTLTGVRRQESTKRAKRNEVEISGHKFSGTIDQFNRLQESEHQCIGGKDKIILNPIIEWTEDEVWEFLNNIVKVPHCQLYDNVAGGGKTRLGCIFCPMASTENLRKAKVQYPKFYALLMRTIRQLREQGCYNKFQDLPDEQIWEWYISKQNFNTWYFKNHKQQKIF